MFPFAFDTGGTNCRSLGFARDDKGDGSASIEGGGASDMSPDADSSLNLPQASPLLDKGEGGASIEGGGASDM